MINRLINRSLSLSMTAKKFSTTSSSIPVFRTVASYREWRRKAMLEEKSVGFVPTMGALHAGHISLMKESLKHNDLTVVSIFVNPAQFAPHEDLDKYPRTFDTDMHALSELSVKAYSSSNNTNEYRTPSAVFAPTVHEMYPSGISQDRNVQKGTFVEVLGYSHQMEGKTRPHFFRGVASIVLRLFNAVEPTRAYFGQKDIQQAVILRRMVRDTLLSHPTPKNLHIIPTARAKDGLALSSRNAYLTPQERPHAPYLYAALLSGKQVWEAGSEPDEVVRIAKNVIESASSAAREDNVEMKLDYISLTDADTFEVPEKREEGKVYLLCGAMKLGTTRLIDNIVLGDVQSILF